MKKLLMILGAAFVWCGLMTAPLAAQDADDTAAVESSEVEEETVSIPDMLKEVEYATKVKPKKKVYVYFFVRSHSGCGPCKALVPKCISMYKEMKGKGGEVIMLNCGKSAETAKAWADEAEMTYPVVTPETAGKVKVPSGGSGGTPNMVAVTSWGEVLEGDSGYKACGVMLDNWKDYVKEAKKAEREKKAKERKKKAKKKKSKKNKKSADAEPSDDSAPSDADF